MLGKRAIRPLLNDQDTPIITGAQQVLIAAAAGDLFRKLEKGDQATRDVTESGGQHGCAQSQEHGSGGEQLRDSCRKLKPHAYVHGGTGLMQMVTLWLHPNS